MDAFGSLVRLNLQPNKNISGTGAGTGVVDLSGLQGQVAVTLDVAPGTGTTPAATVVTQTSPDNTNWTNVSSLTSNFTDFSAIGANGGYQEVALDTRDAQRYLRINFPTLTGTNTPAFDVSALVIGEKKYR